uniref:Uncharacterized protein n=1 Tax=Arion vulgaris TaxID=1028688 RepID=A0A0B7BM93_9EUPU
MQWNEEELNKKIELHNVLKKHGIDLRCIQETHLASTHRFSIIGYDIFRQDKEDRSKE